jgi:nucleoside-diphosphate-sugar epimerase
MKTERILIIGAGGQLGSELTEHLAAKFGKENVLPTDIKEPAAHNYQNFEVLDVLNQSALNAFIKKNNFTQIYHLAAVLSATGEKNPAFAWRLNMDGLFHVLEAAVNFKIAKVYWPSSIAVFGPGTPKQNTPQDTVMDPVTVYGISKLAGERWCEWYHNKYGLDVRSLRYPGLIGYKSHPGGGTTDYAVDIFFKALADKHYECFLKEDTFLPMMYMDDAIKATIDLMEAPAEKIRIRSSYNIGSMSFSPKQIAAEIATVIPEFTITYKPDFRQAIAESWPSSIDDSKARMDWGWTPRYDLQAMTIEILSKLPDYHLLPSR